MEFDSKDSPINAVKTIATIKFTFTANTLLYIVYIHIYPNHSRKLLVSN